MNFEAEEKKIGNLYATDLLPQNLENLDETRLFLQGFAQFLIQYIQDENNRDNKVLDFHQPSELLRKLDLKIPENPMNLSQLLQSCNEVLKYCVKTGHPRFFNQIPCGLDLISMAGEWLTATVNTNMFTYEVASVFILMEQEILRTMMNLIGWTPHEGDGIFTPGGSIANLYAMNSARYYGFPQIKSSGMSFMPKLCAFTSEDSHYSIKSAAAVCGIGTDNCFPIKTDEYGRMIPSALEQEIIRCKKEGFHPFFVCATAGTTVYGAFDPLNGIADVCEKYGLWLHVDAAWGGGLLLSPEYRHKLSGIERANSITWDPHKLMGVTLQCSACFIRHKDLLLKTNQMSADYLFQQDKCYDVRYDTGDKAMQCGRRNDVFKLWLMWRSKGMEGFRHQINRCIDLAKYFTNKIKNTKGFEMVDPHPEFLNICFWYVPESIRCLRPEEKYSLLSKVTPKIKAKMMERGTTMVSYQQDKHRPNFFRMIISNQATTRDDLDFLIEEIINIGKDLIMEHLEIA
uniref:Glutamate decarboxylase n=1 Tax=Acrobeloides nanus TaxID=290746 RepID=A0A914DCG0_9BILA